MAFRDIIGQEKAVNILFRTIERGRVPSTYLFAGESGIGKKFTAINFAKTLNCLEPVTSNELQVTSKTQIQNSELNSSFVTRHSSLIFDCCDECSSCRKIESEVHPDFFLISPQSGQIRIEEIRAIDDALSLKPFEGKWKIVIVDEAHMMNSYAANAFLKTLEEPPKESLIILISSNPDRLPDTIRSRCSRLNFTPLSSEACRKVIETVISQKSNPPSPPFAKGGRKKPTAKKQETESSRPASLDSQLSTLVRLCMGRPGLAISSDLVEERKWFLELLTEMMRAEKDGWASKEEIERWFKQIVLLLRDAAVIQITHDEKNLINVDMNDYIKKFSSSMDLQGIIDNYQQLNTLMGYLNFNLNKSLAWNYTGSLLRRMHDPAEKTQEISSLETKHQE
jgi:DNA polymerase III subunit delta'